MALTSAPATAHHVAPTGLRVVGTGDTTVKLDWDSYSAHSRDYYLVYTFRYGVQVGAAARAEDSAYTVRGLSNGLTYSFHVTAVTNGVETAPSRSVTAWPCWGPFAVGAWPLGCWRPYSPTSPFNRRIPSNPPLVPNSAAIVKRLVEWGPAKALLVGHPDSYPSDYGHPVYYSSALDPLYTVHCTEWTATCAVEGLQLRIPAAARPASGNDGHMAVVDQATGWEWDFWQVKDKPHGGGVLTVSHGGRTRINGDGLGSNATAGHFGLQAGVLRAEEWQAGKIDHALFIAVKCSSGSSLYPAAATATAAPCAQFGDTNDNAPPVGARLQLAMSDAEIGALIVPGWKKTILRAMARYGMIVGDTFNYTDGSFGLLAQSDIQYTVFGYPGRYAEFGAKMGARTFNGAYVFDIHEGVDWARYLRVVHPCVSAGIC